MKKFILKTFTLCLISLTFFTEMTFAQESDSNKNTITQTINDSNIKSSEETANGSGKTYSKQTNDKSNIEQNRNNKNDNKKSRCYFFIIQAIFLFLVFFGYPLFCLLKYYFIKENKDSSPLRGLDLPKGSVRAMIAIAIIGSYLITLSIGSLVISDDYFDKIIAAFGGLVGAVVGFYFGSRNSDRGDGKPDTKSKDNKNPNQDAN